MENSYHCKDYITEKLYTNGFLMETVPIVWGAKKSDYNVPEKSVIFIEDYESMDDLADYLEYLDKNDTAYLEYFQWRKIDLSSDSTYYYKDAKYYTIGQCNLCSAVNEKQSEKMNSTVVESIHNWIYKEENPECLYGSSSFSSGKLNYKSINTTSSQGLYV